MPCCETINTLPCQPYCGSYDFTNVITDPVRMVFNLEWNGNNTCKDYGVIDPADTFTVVWADFKPLIGVQYVIRVDTFDENGNNVGTACLLTSFYHCNITI